MKNNRFSRISNNGAAKTTLNQRFEICERYKAGESLRELAKAFNIDHTAIHKLLIRYKVLLRKSSEIVKSEDHKKKLSKVMNLPEIRAKSIQAAIKNNKRPEVRTKISNTHKLLNTQPPSNVMVGENNPNWIDGNAKERCRSKRRAYGYDPLNEPFEGSVGHHLDRVRVINIPEDLHKSVPHSQNNQESMNQINILAWDFMEASVL